MAKGISLHIGLNAVSAAAYGGWSGELNACEADANDMEALAKSRGFKTTKLLTKAGTRNEGARRRQVCRDRAQFGGRLLPHLLRSRRATPRPERRRGRQSGRDVVPLRRRASR